MLESANLGPSVFWGFYFFQKWSVCYKTWHTWCHRQHKQMLQIWLPDDFYFKRSMTRDKLFTDNTHHYHANVSIDVKVIRYDMIRDAILTCAWKPTWVGLIYRTEPTTKKCKNRKNKQTNTRLTALCPGLPGWTGTRNCLLYTSPSPRD